MRVIAESRNTHRDLKYHRLLPSTMSTTSVEAEALVISTDPLHVS